jgi:ABC-type transporter Mla subunit MlaD
VEPNQQKIVKLLSALIAVSAIVVMAVLAVALDEEQTGSGTGTVATEAAGGMSTGATVTTTTPPTALPVPEAQPTLKADVPKGFR